jgi:hypothetical protein
MALACASTRILAMRTSAPSGLGAVSFSVYVDPAGIEVDSDTYSAANSAQYELAIKAILPAAIKLATENNARILELRRLDRG